MVVRRRGTGDEGRREVLGKPPLGSSTSDCVLKTSSTHRKEVKGPLHFLLPPWTVDLPLKKRVSTIMVSPREVSVGKTLDRSCSKIKTPRTVNLFFYNSRTEHGHRQTSPSGDSEKNIID